MKYTKELLESLIKKSKSVADVMRFLEIKITGGNHAHISKQIKSFEINTNHFLGQNWAKGRILDKRRLKPEEILIENNKRRMDAQLLRRALLESGIEYKCFFCSIKEWNNKKLTLHVDHINGDWSNNKIENLRFLCPNCHSQTDTYGAKNIKIKPEPKIRIPKPRPTKIVWPSKEEMEKLVWQKPIYILCKELNVSDNAIIKHCKKHNINKPPAGYWLKTPL